MTNPYGQANIGQVVGASAPRDRASINGNLESARELAKLVFDTLTNAVNLADRIDGQTPPSTKGEANVKPVPTSAIEETAEVLRGCHFSIVALRDQLQRIDALV